MPNSLVDFAIVTALKVERDAVLIQLDEHKVIQKDLEPLTYYYGYVNIPGSDERYTVVVMLLLDMGNDEAATATTRLLHRWQPANLLMVGIAGGVRGKVELGDVVVARFVFYYELAKLTSTGKQHRPEQFPSDRLLYGRAYVYEETEWRGTIGVAYPRTSPEENSVPHVHFEPIASGEKVIADSNTLPKLLKECPKLAAVAMEGAGVARAARSHTDPPRFLEIRGICDFADPTKNDDWHSYAANAAAAFTIGLLRSRPVPPLTVEKSSTTKTTKPLLVMCAQSLRKITPDEILTALNDDLRGRQIETLSLDFTDCMSGGVFINPESAAQRLTNPQGTLSSAIARRGDVDLAFHGLVHIPIAVLIGHLVSDRQSVRMFDFQTSTDSNSWAWFEEGQNFPSMEVYGIFTNQSWQAKDVVLRVSVTYRVQPAQTFVVSPDGAIEIDLTLPSPERGIVRSEKQTREYGKIFRRTLDLIAQHLPIGQRVHLFYGGPVALAFHIGQQISENIHPPVVVWNFHRSYDWAIDLAAAYIGETCVTQPE